MQSLQFYCKKTRQKIKLAQTTNRAKYRTLLEEDFEEPFDLSCEWKEEISKRCHQIDEGQVELTPGDKVLAEVAKRLRK